MNDTIVAAWRTSLILGVLLIIARILGRRTLAQLTFFDFVVGITIGNIAASTVSETTNILPTIASLATATFWVLVIGALSMKSLPARKILEDQPIVVVYKGRILEDNLSKKYYNVNDLLELLREQGVFSPSEVEVALLETDGALSILKKPDYQEVTLGSLFPSNNDSLVMSNMVGKELIIDGKIISENLQAAGMSNADLLRQLERNGVSQVDDVILGIITPKGELYIDKRKDVAEEG